jgi:chromosomal replication initiation ATPase DnaA
MDQSHNLDGQLVTIGGHKYLLQLITDKIRSLPDVAIMGVTLATVCQYYDISPLDVRGTSRRGDIVRARHLTWYILHRVKQMTSISIAAFFDTDHTTILHASEKIQMYRSVYGDVDVDAGICIDLVEKEIHLLTTNKTQSNGQ